MTDSRRPSPAQAQRLADHHFVDRYDRAQLTALDRVEQLDRAATPLVVPTGINRVYRTQPTHPPARATRLAIAGPEFRVARDTLLDLINLRLVHADHLLHLHGEPGPSPGKRAGEQRSAYVLTPTRHGHDVLDVARRIGRLPHPHRGHGHGLHGRKGSP
jgi:hypothetical protein